MSKKLIAAVDFGNNKLSVAVANKESNGNIELIDYKEVKIKEKKINGIIANPNNMLGSLNTILNEIERENNILIGAYYYGLEPHTLRSHVQSSSCQSSGNNFLQTIEHLTDNVRDSFAQPDRTIYSTQLLESVIGTTSKGDFLVLSLDNEIKNTIDKIAVNFSTERKAMAKISVMAQADVFLSKEQKQKGALFIDFGGDVTSFAVYRNGMPRMVAVLPLGGKHITQDIAQRFGLEESMAEILKQKIGAKPNISPDPNYCHTIKEKNSGKTLTISANEFAETVEARQCEIIDFVLKEVDFNNLKNDFVEIMAVGNATNLIHFKELLEAQSGKPVISPKVKLPTADNILDNKLLIALLEQADVDCRGVEKPKPIATEEANNTKKNSKKNAKNKEDNEKTPNGFLGRMLNLFEDNNEKNIER